MLVFKFLNMMKNYFTITVCSFLILLNSCGNKNTGCEQFSPPDPLLDIVVVDAEGNSLLGDNGIYKPSNMVFENENGKVELKYDNGTSKSLKFNIDDVNSGQDYSLKLNDQETETINMTIEKLDEKCGSYLNVISVKLNGKDIGGVRKIKITK